MILNLTQHPATEEQRKAGVVDLHGSDLAALKSWLNFDAVPSMSEIKDRAHRIVRAGLYNGLGGEFEDIPVTEALIGGAPFLMSALETELIENGIVPLYAFSRRESVEQELPDGSVRKVNVFRHEGFVRVA